MACDPQIHRPVHLSDNKRLRFGSDVVFVGSYYPWRAEYLEQFAGLMCRYGALGGEITCGFSAPGLYQGRPYSAGNMAQIYSANKIVLPLRVLDPKKAISGYQASPRGLEALACGAFVLTDRQNDVFSLFRDGEHSAAFTDARDLRKKVHISWPARRRETESRLAAGRKC